jgi:hypothetical protein
LSRFCPLWKRRLDGLKYVGVHMSRLPSNAEPTFVYPEQTLVEAKGPKGVDPRVVPHR